ncbi:MAG TPA: hypothetical protein VLV17_08320 [Anaeromyxobacteraceae bacterium]|nr:hypothetical protein [Anaeromyxobacteraceae bacterium]
MSSRPERSKGPSFGWFLLLLVALEASAARAADGAAAPNPEAPPVALASVGSPLVPLPPPPPGMTAIPVSTPAPARAGRGYRILGLSLDAGVPNGASATLLYRPLKYLRLGGGLLYNYIGYGALASVSLQPHYWIAPSLSLEAGHYFDANALDKVARFTTVDASVQPLLEQVGYTFVNAQVGLELGAPSTFVFFVRGGLSRVWLNVNNAQAAAQAASGTSGTRLTSIENPSVRLGLPCAKAGFMFYFY